MAQELNHKDPSWVNALMLVAIFLTLSLALILAYKGWKEDHALHHSDHGGASKIIADITVNLSGVPYREHCMTCHPQGKAANLPGQPIVSRNHPAIVPHSMDDLGCTGCHLGEGMAGDILRKKKCLACHRFQKTALDKKYPGENWGKYKFPKFVYISDAVQTGYKIAVKNPELLAQFSCYCFCEGMGHKNLAYCFLEKGVAGGNFDDHASTCNVCFAQAMMAFLWDEMGATDAEMQKAMKEIYGK